MAGVNFFISETAAGEYRSDGIALLKLSGILSQNGVLRRGGMSFEKLTRAEIIGILHISCGVMLRDIESLKAVVIIGYLGIILNGKSHAQKDAFNLSADKSYRMIRAEIGVAGHRFVIALRAVDKSFFFKRFKLLKLLRNCVLDKLLRFVYLLTCFLLHLIGNIAKLLHKPRHMAFFAEELNSELLNIGNHTDFCRFFFKKLFQLG